ncbi:hypothetical protein G9A89_014770 [Geosiphon pyriformis]|nr:hypothetical protein G9A89_014770 [Geosiphon pyriformis]
MPSSFNAYERDNLFRNPSSSRYGFPALQTIVVPHIESFNSLLEPKKQGLLHAALVDLEPQVISDSIDGKSGNILRLWIEDITLSRPMLPDKNVYSTTKQIYPSECRERLTTYQGRMHIQLNWTVNSGTQMTDSKFMGYLPIMVKLVSIHSYLIRHHEESEEIGGYFIINGIEKIIRLLLVPRRNHVMALIRPSFQKRGPDYTQYATSIRCARTDQSTQTISVHYLRDGNCMLRLRWKKQEYMVPVILILKALADVSDKQIFDHILQGENKNTFLTDRLELMLSSAKILKISKQQEFVDFLGQKFHVALGLPPHLSSDKVGTFLLRKVIFVHLQHNLQKFHLLIFMIRKLYALVAGECCADNSDSPANQEILLSGHLYGMIIKEKLQDYLNQIKATFAADIRNSANKEQKPDFTNKIYVEKTINKVRSEAIGQKLSYFLATGNLISNTGLDLSQSSGYTIVAEKLNFYRYISHFRCVHRGSFFAELKTTSVRKLLPEAWGFICPVHTPDGSPCGLLNHLSCSCKIITSDLNMESIQSLLAPLGLLEPEFSGRDSRERKILHVLLNGRIIGVCSAVVAQRLATTLRLWKVLGEKGIPMQLEIAYVPPSNGGLFPGLYLFTSMARMMRPVKYLANGKTDLIGTFEQVYMNIACLDEDIVPGITTHQEISPTNILSILANLTPFSDHNQSPRNMYQCQMSKQTMGTPGSALTHRTDNKLYRLQSGQSPIARPEIYNKYGLDGFPNGTNAIVAVLAYTGYDMEDAMIVNRQSHHRGFAYGTIYKSEVIDLNEMRRRGEPIQHHFMLGSDVDDAVLEKLDKDGMPFVGIRLVEGDPLYAYFDDTKGTTYVKFYKGPEMAYVDQVRLLGDDLGQYEAQRAHIKLRIPRPSVIGDKFSSRHGQKGVLSQLWPQYDMPFTESGMQPDIIINPHAFPSRMTIGMFVESLAGKAGALHGIAQDATPFRFDEKHPAMDHFGEQLLRAGYNYHGNEPLYSGVTGEEFHADIYIGVVFYQRLRHMVSDKWQVRSTGPVHNLTMQPIGGRARHGGVRFGEMERDSMLAHGMSFCLQDRLMNCSDYSQCLVCRKCGSIFSALSLAPRDRERQRRKHHVVCSLCNTAEHVVHVKIPFAFKYLATELMSMGIKMMVEAEP